MATIESTIFFRVDAHPSIGKGHFMRCLTLAKQLQKSGCAIIFLCAAVDQSSISTLAINGIEYFSLASETPTNFEDFDFKHDAQSTIRRLQQVGGENTILIVDRYVIDALWHRMLKPYVHKLCVIDDLNNRYYDCDMLIDQSYGKTQADYQPWVPHYCQLCIGAEYCLVSDTFLKLRLESLQSREKLSSDTFKVLNVLITMGGSDINNITTKILHALAQLKNASSLSLTIVMGSLCPYIEEVKAEAKAFSFHKLSLIVDAKNMAELMTEADICISAAGSILWEACVLGLPTLALITADNQKRIASELSEQGAIYLLGEASALMERELSQQFNQLIVDSQQLSQLSYRSAQICDGLGAERAVEVLL